MQNRHKVIAGELTNGDPCYWVHGHIDPAEMRREIAAMSDHGEDEESASEYHISHVKLSGTDESWRISEEGWAATLAQP
jgi:Icc-related predicted phosphoesterase